MTRTALSIVLVVSLVVAGIILFGPGDAPIEEAAPTTAPIEEAASAPSTSHDHESDDHKSHDHEATESISADDTHAHHEDEGAVVDPPEAQAAPDTASDTSTEPGGDSDTTPTTAAPNTTATTIKASSGPLAIPATVAYPGGLKRGEGFSLLIACIDNETVTCDLSANGKKGIGGFQYFGHGMPYLYSEAIPGNHDHAWWVDGDREAYRCAYGFLYDKHPNPFGMFPVDRPAEFIIRATIVRPLGQGYARVNDAFMDEGVRYWDGSLADEGAEILSESCQTSALDDFDYDNYVPQGPDSIRVGLFRKDGEIADIRDFTKFTPAVPGHFEFISFKDGRVTLVFILGASNKPSHVFYYDVLGSGRIAVEVNGKLLQ